MLGIGEVELDAARLGLLLGDCGFRGAPARLGTDLSNSRFAVFHYGHGDIAVTLAGQVGFRATSGAEAAAVASTNGGTDARRARPGVDGPRLQRAAQEHACEMAGRGLMTHVGTRSAGPGGRVKALGYLPRVTSENIAAGRMGLSRTLHEWQSSPDHQANMVIPGLRHLRIGHAIGSDGKTACWAAVYAQPQ